MPDPLSIWVAALLSLERLTYAAVWRTPNAFRRWSERSALQRSAIDTLALLFVGFKVLQAGVFAAWCWIQSGGSLTPYSSDPRVLLAGALLVAAGSDPEPDVCFARWERSVCSTGIGSGTTCRGEHTFPFTWFDHPQYVGTVLTIWGFFVLMRFPADDWVFVPVLETIYYAVGAWFERDSIPTDERYARAKE